MHGHTHTARAQDPTTPAEALSRFPYCECDDYKCANSPWKVDYTSTTPGPVKDLVCFSLTWVSRLTRGWLAWTLLGWFRVTTLPCQTQ